MLALRGSVRRITLFAHSSRLVTSHSLRSVLHGERVRLRFAFILVVLVLGRFYHFISLLFLEALYFGDSSQLRESS